MRLHVFLLKRYGRCQVCDLHHLTSVAWHKCAGQKTVKVKADRETECHCDVNVLSDRDGGLHRWLSTSLPQRSVVVNRRNRLQFHFGTVAKGNTLPQQKKMDADHLSRLLQNHYTFSSATLIVCHALIFLTGQLFLPLLWYRRPSLTPGWKWPSSLFHHPASDPPLGAPEWCTVKSMFLADHY